MKPISVLLILMLIVVVAAVLVWKMILSGPVKEVSKGQALAEEFIAHEERIADFVLAVLKRDRLAAQLLYPSNVLLFSRGYRPSAGVLDDPEANGVKITDLRQYFIRKVYLDVRSLSPINQSGLQALIDRLGDDASENMISLTKIALRYNLQLKGRSDFRAYLKNIPSGKEREAFKQWWFNDVILSTERRVLGWMFRELYGISYVIPEHR